MWNERYAGADYFYGTEPNTFLAEHAKLLTGPVLSLAEGEGRNAVFLASLGLDVLGVDSSEVGLAKAQNLAAAKGVTKGSPSPSLSVKSGQPQPDPSAGPSRTTVRDCPSSGISPRWRRRGMGMA